MNTSMITGSVSDTSTSQLATLHGLPFPLNDEDGGGDCYPNEENETGP
ncbi:MAG: hypothetical protein GY719_17735 [bacterium]|nr:hypothetical protein [bacterium]